MDDAPLESRWTRHYEASARIRARAEDVFAHIDDHALLASHMSKSSWMMGGGRMDIHLDQDKGQRVGSMIGLTGRVFGLQVSLQEKVTERVVPYRKRWEIIGVPRLLIIGSYRMGFDVAPLEKDASTLRVMIDYALPERAPGRWLGILFANYYAKWCVEQMINDARTHFESAHSTARMRIES